MSKKIIAFVVLSTCLTACSMEPESPPAIVVPDQKSVEQQMEKNVEAKAEEYHVAPELSDDFIQQYLDMDSFEELRERTLEGIWITQDQANMTKDEINLWEQVSQAEGFTAPAQRCTRYVTRLCACCPTWHCCIIFSSILSDFSAFLHLPAKLPMPPRLTLSAAPRPASLPAAQPLPLLAAPRAISRA